MTQAEINSAVAMATGESLPEIHRRGFSIADPFVVRFDPEPSDMPPHYLDWDQTDAVEPVRRVHTRRKPTTG